MVDAKTVEEVVAETSQESEQGRGEEVVGDHIDETLVPLTEERECLHRHLDHSDIVLAKTRNEHRDGVEFGKQLHVR